MEKFNYEKALLRLEEITSLLEKGELNLDDTVKLYTEGTELVAKCSKVLETAQIKVTELMGKTTDE